MSAQKVYVTKRFSFEAAHYLPNYNGKCANLHGHSYKLEVTFSDVKNFIGHEDDNYKAEDYMVIDFTKLKKFVEEEVTSKLDHINLNSVYTIPTAEVMCVYIYESIKVRVNELRESNSYLKLEEVKLWETEDSFATYRGECE